MARACFWSRVSQPVTRATMTDKKRAPKMVVRIVIPRPILVTAT